MYIRGPSGNICIFCVLSVVRKLSIAAFKLDFLQFKVSSSKLKYVTILIALPGFTTSLLFF
ncbi:hypothetical protein RPO_07390 [Rickettsia rickettsii str. Arizona]|uniref:Uncharacterized protein n=1 Tax=Rickettsia rickettsii (strain Sheila Smith) TaxID=392021 RepID=A0A0H3AZ22_RICRS|nr:hypothetical protein A1G_07340 [Rickettsia rickettsii str. 'Sheila Smith']AFB22867.1 hypothetical protein RPN_07070 [Rickettsia rickettsii str. Brazil]AFB24246.1 hypothetical protein RPL_07385 [Rickettsia rickettsii str. Colombia]AFB25589.1 hypothetical protein RPO_07390 [Rickettsia rickettsii str. Arizona]AFB28269.1 hypothetical protein RPJ_07355 [Rickettsia rickettsii str. Hino]AFB30930.1 hypothetical protein RPM_07365 [Rickettsia rickettsii str. Hauke]